ncbi:otoancorin [Labrus bergylta]|uniref:Otoancorin n=1 Tax=Labrus bergylta TaxID=56723 RepID=A0A3Q3EJB6_9LABR|nr:stereocilin-like [Labrus bergylta]
MAPKGGTFFFLLMVACAVSSLKPDDMPRDVQAFKHMARRLMKKCKKNGSPMPEMTLLNTVFVDSELPLKETNEDRSNSFLPTFLSVLLSVSPVKNPPGRVRLDDMDKMTNDMLNCRNLLNMINRMKTSPESSATCYMKAFMAPMSWVTLKKKCVNNISSDDYDTLLSAAKPVVLDMPSSRVNLPDVAVGPNLMKWMGMLRSVYGVMSAGQRTRVLKWAKEQILQNDFNCTTNQSPDSKSTQMKPCKPSLKWMSSGVLDALGPFISGLKKKDVDSSTREKLCEFFFSVHNNDTGSGKKPSVAKDILQGPQECPNCADSVNNLLRLSPLACFCPAHQNMTADLSRKLLPQLDHCDVNNFQVKKLKKNLVKSLMSNSNTSQALQDLGSSVNLLSPKQLSKFACNDIKELVSNVEWTRGQLRTLVKKCLGDKKCKEVSVKELMDLGSIAVGLPGCVLKHVRAKEILNDIEGLKKISKRMRKGQLKAMLQGVMSENVDISELVQKLPDSMIPSVSLKLLEKASISSLDQLKNKTLTPAQAAFLAKKMFKQKKPLFRKLRSVLQGITCKMIDEIGDSEVQNMVQDIEETPQWLPKVAAGCAARKLFGRLEKTRVDYFKTITDDEMDEIPPILILQLPPGKLKDLPDSVCPVFLDKMKVANLSSLPLRSPSRPEIIKRALLCIANGKNFSVITTEDVATIQPLLCELSPSQLRLMAPYVRNTSLEAMASCQQIPQRHIADLMKLIIETYGSSSDWSAETLDKLGCLLFLDDKALAALPCKPWVKDALYSLMSSCTIRALGKKLFECTTNTASNAARRKRTVRNTMDAKVPTAEMIEELQSHNVFWTHADLEKISEETFVTTVETLGDVLDYSQDQLDVLSDKATETFGPVSQMNESVVMQLGCIIQGFLAKDLSTLPFSLDSLEDISHCGWTESQLELVWMAVAGHDNITVQQLEAADLVSLNQFICGLSSNEINQINVDTFKEAVGSINDIQCSSKIAQQLKNIAVSAFGNPSTWTEAEVSDLGNIIAGLNATDLASINPPVFSFLRSSSIPLITPNNFAALTDDHLRALGPDNAAMVTSEQQAALTEKQRSALESALTGDTSSTPEPLPSSQSGAPSLAVEGILSFMKPLLFLVMSLLLL